MVDKKHKLQFEAHLSKILGEGKEYLLFQPLFEKSLKQGFPHVQSYFKAPVANSGLIFKLIKGQLVAFYCTLMYSAVVYTGKENGIASK